MDTSVSLVLSLFAAIFFMWINSSQKEFDQFQDKPKSIKDTGAASGKGTLADRDKQWDV